MVLFYFLIFYSKINVKQVHKNDDQSEVMYLNEMSKHINYKDDLGTVVRFLVRLSQI
jgi:hypothetical protein